MENVFKTFDEQIEILKERKKITFPNLEDEEDFKKRLKECNYVNLINPYKIYFCNGKKNGKFLYKEHTSFQKYLEYYEKDIDYSHQILKAVFRVEKKIGTLVSYHLSEALVSNANYFKDVKENSINNLKNKNIFESSDIDTNYYLKEFQKKLEDEKEKFLEEEFLEVKKAYDISEFQKAVSEKYEIIDISKTNWFLTITFLSFEDILFLFKILSRETQMHIISSMNIGQYSIGTFNDITRNIKKLRNKLAHQENLSIIIDKQLLTHRDERIIEGKRAFNTIKFTYAFLGEDIPKIIDELELLHSIRAFKYKFCGK